MTPIDVIRDLLRLHNVAMEERAKATTDVDREIWADISDALTTALAKCRRAISA